jgi:hypothetical protein
MSATSKSAKWRGAVGLLRANPLEWGLLVFAVAIIVVAMVATTTVTLTGDAHNDLTFSGAVGELSRTLKDRGPEQVGAVQRATLAVGPDTVTVDTLAVTADSAVEPAFAHGGFLGDQVARYNDNVVRQAVRAAAAHQPQARGRVETSSVFRLVWTDSGTMRLSDTANALGLAIRSPYAEGSWRPVRTVDWHSSPALLGYDGQLALAAMSDSTRYRASLNGRECEVRAELRSRHLIYCTSAVGTLVNRFFDVGFTTTGAGASTTFAAMFPYRPREVWIDGKLEKFVNRSTTAGTLVELRATGGFLLSGADWGTLATEQWINGRATFFNQRAGTLSFFGRAGRTPSDAVPTATPLTLSFDARLSNDLDRGAREFLAAHGSSLRRMVVVVMDAPTGEIRAISEPHRQSDDEPLLSFEPLLIGSAVKPIVAAAILSRQPDLANLRIATPDSLVSAISGTALVKPFRSAPNGCSGAVDVVQFLRCSNNQFAAELVMRSLKANGYTRGNVPRAVLEASDIANGLAEVFDVDAYAGRTAGRFGSYWTPSDSIVSTAAPVTQDRTLIPWESRPWLVFPKSETTPVDWIARWAFGGWENRWTLVGAAQAYARIVTGRNIQGTFLHANGPRVVAPTPVEAAAAFATVREGLERVALDGTAKGMTTAFRIDSARPLTVFAKTGTLNEGEANTRMKALVVAVGEPADSSAGAPLRCGLITVTYFEFADEWNKMSRANALPSVHLEFAREKLAPTLTRQWKRVSGCAPPLVPRRAGQLAQQSGRAK